MTNVRKSIDNPMADADTNVLGSINLLEACRKYQVKKFVFSSTGGALYGDTDVLPTPESHPTKPISPYGIATRETLTKLTMWNAMQKKLKKADDVAPTYQLAANESVDMAFIALSQVMRDGKVTQGSWWLVPADFHQPVRQSAVLLSGAQDPAAAQALLDFLQSEKARAVMRGYGYESP